jgi:hypothetical protein
VEYKWSSEHERTPETLQNSMTMLISTFCSESMYFTTFSRDSSPKAVRITDQETPVASKTQDNFLIRNQSSPWHL